MHHVTEIIYDRRWWCCCCLPKPQNGTLKLHAFRQFFDAYHKNGAPTFLEQINNNKKMQKFITFQLCCKFTQPLKTNWRFFYLVHSQHMHSMSQF